VRLGLVVPVYNEQARLQEFVPQLLDFIDEQDPGSELVVVDDGSVDGTADEVERIARSRPGRRWRVLRRPHQGKGAAVASGLDATTGEIRAFCDLDLSTPLSELQRVIDVAARADVLAIGSRDLATSVLVEPQGKVRESLGRLYNRLMQATVTPGIVDTQCGAKAASAEVWERVLRHCRQTGFAWDAETIAVALALGIVVHEVPIQWSHDERSKVHVLRDGLNMVAETPQLWRSAGRARATVPSTTAGARTAGQGGVFDDVNADEMRAVDRSHWWFRSKAALVATAIERSERAERTGSAGVERGWLVDAGGGSGGVTAMLGWPVDRVVVLEGNWSLVSTARNELGLDALRGEVEALPLAPSSVDAVSLLDVIEHLEDPGAALREARRILQPDGRLIVNVPAHRWLWSQADVALGHQRRYTRRALRSELRQAGFEPEILTHVFSWLVPAVLVLRRLARPSQPELGLDKRSPTITAASLVPTALERTVVGRIPLPLGTSILCVARPATR
jgi:dolichyl-phosphate beta-glucosyltransferase